MIPLPQSPACMDPMGMRSFIYGYTQNEEALDRCLVVPFCLCFANCKAMGANDPRGGSEFGRPMHMHLVKVQN